MSLLKNEIELITSANAGNQDSLNLLIELARPKVQQYIYRMTLNHHETQDIVQETLIDMAKCLGQLENYDKFWPWLRRVAFNKLKNHQRKEFKQKDLADKLYSGNRSEQSKGLSNLISEELSEVVMQTMRQLKSDHRRVLVLRCYEEMTYPEIADVMERSEFGTRMLFVRAKNALKKKLAKNGLSKATLLTTLITFGIITDTSQAAVSTQVASASLNAGFAASITAGITTVAFAVKLAAVVIAVTSVSLLINEGGSYQKTDNHTLNRVPAHMLCIMSDPKNYTEYWYSFPDGPNGPFISRFTVRDAQNGHTIGQWFQTSDGNYFYDRNADTVYLLNHNFYNSDFSIMRLPIDSQKMTSNIDTAYNTVSGFDNYVKYNGSGLFYLKGIDQDGQPYTQAGQQQNIPKEEFFNLTWAKTAGLVDLRDDIHKSGWANFSVSGKLNGKTVKGNGRIPLYLNTLQANYPWMHLNIAGNDYYFERLDFPAAFSRPWLGLHTIDSLRRDIVNDRIAPGSIYFDSQSVDISFKIDNYQVVYEISLDKDLVKSVRVVSSSGSEIGNMIFSYNTDNINAPGKSLPDSRLDSLIDVIEDVVQ